MRASLFTHPGNIRWYGKRGCRGVFRNQSNVYGGGFLQKQLIDFSLTIFAKGSNIDVGLGLELVSEINMTTKMTTSKKTIQ